MSPQTIVVGGGIAGLLCATHLALGGARVTLLERRSAWGGRASSALHDGHLLNQGPHALYREGALQRALQELGCPAEGAHNPVEFHCMRGGEDLGVFPSGAWGLLSSPALDLRARWELAGTLARLPQMEAGPWQGRSLADWADTFASPRSRTLLTLLGRLTTYCWPPEQLSAGAVIEQIRLGLGGVLYVHGGWGSIVDSLRARAQEAGVELRTGAAATGLELKEGRVVAVRVGEERLPAEAVVLALPPAAAAALCPESAALAQIHRELVPVKAAVLDLGLRSLPVPGRRGALSEEQPAYMALHSDARGLAPEGGLLCSAYWLHSGEAPGRAELEAWMDQAQPGWREQVVMSRYLPSLLVTPALPLASRGGLAGRPGPVVEDVRGLYIVGDHVGPEGHLADAAAASARSLARRLQPARAAAA